MRPAGSLRDEPRIAIEVLVESKPAATAALALTPRTSAGVTRIV